MTRISDERLEELIKELPYAEHNDTERGPCIACDALLAVRELRAYRKERICTACKKPIIRHANICSCDSAEPEHVAPEPQEDSRD